MNIRWFQRAEDLHLQIDEMIKILFYWNMQDLICIIFDKIM